MPYKTQEARQAYRSKNAERLRINKKIYNAANRTLNNLQRKSWAERNPEKIKAYRKIHRRKHRTRLLIRKKEFYKNNKRKISIYLARYRIETSKARCAAARKWALENPEKRRAIAQASGHKRRALIAGSAVNPRSILIFISSVRAKKTVTCYYCQQPTPGKSAHLDHIIPLSKGGAHSVENLCVACPHCNQTKLNKPIQEWMRLGQQILAL